MNTSVLEEASVKLGAFRASVYPVEKIPFDKGLRKYCEANYCGSYGKNYACPPGVGDPDTVIEKAKAYTYALVFQTVAELEDSYDFEGMTAAAERHSEISEKIAELLESDGMKFLKLTAGGCNICKVCAQAENKPCRFPDKAISSLEAYCMNVASLAEKCGMKYTNGQNTVTYFGAYLFN